MPHIVTHDRTGGIDVVFNTYVGTFDKQDINNAIKETIAIIQEKGLQQIVIIGDFTNAKMLGLPADFATVKYLFDDSHLASKVKGLWIVDPNRSIAMLMGVSIAKAASGLQGKLVDSLDDAIAGVKKAFPE